MQELSRANRRSGSSSSGDVSVDCCGEEIVEESGHGNANQSSSLEGTGNGSLNVSGVSSFHYPFSC